MSIHPTMHQSIQLSIYQIIHLSINWLIHPIIQPYNYAYIHPSFIPPSIHNAVKLEFYIIIYYSIEYITLASIHQTIQLTMHSSHYSSIHLTIHLFNKAVNWNLQYMLYSIYNMGFSNISISKLPIFLSIHLIKQ